MQIVREITSKKAIYMFPDFEPIDIDASRMVVGRLKALDIRNTTHEVVSADAPALWVGGGVLTFDLAWAISNQLAYDDALALRFAEQANSTEQYIQEFLDDTAKLSGYDSIISACSYSGAVNTYQDESVAFLQWRAEVWAYVNSELAKVKAGTRPMPTSPSVIISELPVYSYVKV